MNIKEVIELVERLLWTVILMVMMVMAMLMLFLMLQCIADPESAGQEELKAAREAFVAADAACNPALTARNSAKHWVAKYHESMNK